MTITAEAIAANPKLKALVAQGAFDPLGAGSASRVAIQGSDHGNVMTARTLFSNDVRALIRSAVTR
jgi:ABC-type sugar transport system substrate-binding protein